MCSVRIRSHPGCKRIQQSGCIPGLALILCHPENILSIVKIAITIDEDLLSRLDRMVKEGKYSNRSQAIQEAVEYRIEAVTKTRLARESAKLYPGYEQMLADEGLEGDLSELPKY